MPLIFPNKSRSYDPSHNRVRFVGYDGVFEIAFLVEADALTTGNRDHDETNYLAAFDAARDAIEQAAQQAYSKGRNTMIVLTAADVR